MALHCQKGANGMRVERLFPSYLATSEQYASGSGEIEKDNTQNDKTTCNINIEDDVVLKHLVRVRWRVDVFQQPKEDY